MISSQPIADGLSLGFHIIFACIGMVMPFFMAVAHYKWLITKDAVYKSLTKAWSKGVAIFFATGAVSGTVLSFELGLCMADVHETCRSNFWNAIFIGRHRVLY
jgi:cytochrome bd-type quinol oxidase subunit 1